MSNNGHNGYRTSPLYTFAEVAHLAHVSTSTVRNWLFGYTTNYGDVAPLFNPSTEQGPMVSFLQLVEIVVAAQFRKAERLSFRTVRRAYENAQSEWGLEYPFAHLRLEALGGHIVRRLHAEDKLGSLQAADTPEQWTLPSLVVETIRQFDYEPDLVIRWYPVGKSIPIVVDPHISAGLPTIVGRGVTVGAIQKRFRAGQLMDFIADDFEIERSVVEEAVRYAPVVATR
jgi:uncharacterized protein (DUF433 family)